MLASEGPTLSGPDPAAGRDLARIQPENLTQRKLVKLLPRRRAVGFVTADSFFGKDLRDLPKEGWQSAAYLRGCCGRGCCNCYSCGPTGRMTSPAAGLRQLLIMSWMDWLWLNFMRRVSTRHRSGWVDRDLPWSPRVIRVSTSLAASHRQQLWQRRPLLSLVHSQY